MHKNAWLLISRFSVRPRGCSPIFRHEKPRFKKSGLSLFTVLSLICPQFILAAAWSWSSFVTKQVRWYAIENYRTLFSRSLTSRFSLRTSFCNDIGSVRDLPTVVSRPRTVFSNWEILYSSCLISSEPWLRICGNLIWTCVGVILFVPGRGASFVIVLGVSELVDCAGLETPIRSTSEDLDPQPTTNTIAKTNKIQKLGFMVYAIPMPPCC